jgi:hypothetical protein
MSLEQHTAQIQTGIGCVPHVSDELDQRGKRRFRINGGGGVVSIGYPVPTNS